MSDEDLFSLFEECRKRGVMHLRLKNDAVGEVEFTLMPQPFGAPGEDVLSSLAKETPSDPKKCMLCQNAPRDGRLAGHCRQCSLIAAGVTS